jgi:hypothetical protein
MGKPNWIYIGPNIPAVGLKRNTIHREEIMPDALAKYAAIKPVVKSLFVSTARLAEAEKNLSKPGSLEHHAYKEMTAYAKAAKAQT